MRNGRRWQAVLMALLVAVAWAEPVRAEEMRTVVLLDGLARLETPAAWEYEDVEGAALFASGTIFDLQGMLFALPPHPDDHIPPVERLRSVLADLWVAEQVAVDATESLSHQGVPAVQVRFRELDEDGEVESLGLARLIEYDGARVVLVAMQVPEAKAFQQEAEAVMDSYTLETEQLPARLEEFRLFWQYFEDTPDEDRDDDGEAGDQDEEYAV
ncbi:MAG: hypothetical protein LIP77_02990 [Planctomycetes bacterium]|nr:hypothetical protein [Planctomycetota bacterium]